jgi:hypothetical protein
VQQAAFDGEPLEDVNVEDLRWRLTQGALNVVTTLAAGG